MNSVGRDTCWTFVWIAVLMSVLLTLADAFGAESAVCPATGGPAQAETTPEPLPSRVGISQEVPLTLEEAIARVLENNADVESARIDQEISGYALLAARGFFDPRVEADLSWQRSITPVSSVIGGAEGGKLTQKELLAAPELSGWLPWSGGSYQIIWSSSRLVTDNQFATLNPQYPTALSFGLIQPLLRNLTFDDNRRNIEVAKKNQDLSDEQFRQRVIEVTTQAVQAYWDLVFARENLQVQEEALQLARQQVESNERMAAQGILAPIDVNEARIQLAAFEQNVFSAQELLTRAENLLKVLMLEDRRSALWSRALRPVTPANIRIPESSLEGAIEKALKQRPELGQLQATREVSRLNSRYFGDQTRPRVDLVANYRTAGLAGEILPPGPNPFTSGLDDLLGRVNELSDSAGLPPLEPSGGTVGGVPGLLVGGYSTSLDNLLHGRFPTVTVGLRIGLPLRNRTAEANLGASLTEERRVENRHRQMEQIIEADVRTALQSVHSAQARLGSAREQSRAAREQYESEQRRFQAGTSTVFLVLQRQSAMIESQSREVRAETELSKAIAEFQRATADTLQAHGIKLGQNSPTVP